MSGPRFYPSFREASEPTYPNNPISPLSASLMSFDASQLFASAPLSILKLEKPLPLKIGDSIDLFTHHLGGNIFGDKQSLGQYQKIMNTIEKEWPALSKLINAQGPNNRTVVFATNNSSILNEVGAPGVWGPINSIDPRIKHFKTLIMIDVNKGKASIGNVGHEWWHEFQSLNHTFKSGKSPHDLPISISTYLNAADESAVVNCWWKGVEKYSSTPFLTKDPRQIIYEGPFRYFEQFLKEAQAGRQAEAKKAWSVLTQEIGSHMVSARLEHGHEAIQQYAKELGQLIDEKLGVQAFTEPCPEKFKTRLFAGVKRNAGKAFAYAGRVFAALGFGLDVYHEYTQIPETNPNKAAHALINGTIRNLVGQGIAATGLFEALFNDTSHMGSAAEAVRHIESAVGKDRLQKILTKGHQARGLEIMGLPISEDKILHGEERQIYFSYMNAHSRSIQESIQNPISGAYDTVKRSISEYIQSFSPNLESLQKAVSAFGNEITDRLSNLTSWTPAEQKEMITALRSRAEEIFSNIPKMAQAGFFGTKDNSHKPEQTNSSQETLIRSWMNDFQKNGEAVINISIQGVSDEVLKSDKPLTEEQQKTIEAELDSTEKQIIPKLNESAQIGEELDKQLSAKYDKKNKGEYFQKISEAVAKFSAALYMDSLRRYAEKKFETEQEQLEIDFDRRKQRSVALHYREVTGITFSSIERNVWDVLHPSGNFRRSLKDMARFIAVSSQREKEIRKLIDEKNELRKRLDKQDVKLNTIDASIKRKFEKMIKSRSRAIKKHNSAQKALGVMNSVFSLAALIPPLTPFALGAAALTDAAGHGVAMGATHQEKRRMREQFKFRNARERVQDIRDKAAEQAYRQTSDLYHLGQEKNHLRRERVYIMKSNIALDPSEVRKQLYTDREDIAKDIEKALGDKQKTDNSIQEKQKVIDECNQNLDPKWIQAKIEEIQTAIDDHNKKDLEDLKANPEKLFRGRGNSSKTTSGKGSKKKRKSRKGSKKNSSSTSNNEAKSKEPPSSNTKEENSKSIEELTMDLLYYQSLAASNKTSTELKLAELEAELSELQSQSLDQGTLLNDLFNEQTENQTDIEREERLAEMKDTGYKAIMKEFNKYKPKSAEAEEIQDYLDELFPAYHSLRNAERAAVFGILGGFDEILQELTFGPVLKGVLEALSPILPQKMKDGIERAPIYLQYVSKLAEHAYKIHDAYDNLKLAQDELGKIRKKNGQDSPSTFEKVENKFINGFKWLESEKLDRLRNPFQWLMDNKSIQEFGPLRYVNEILVPAINIASSALASLRIMNHIAHGCPRILSPEEMKLDKIQEFLTAFSQHLDQNFLSIINYLGDNHQEVIDRIDTMRSELGVVGKEIAAEIDYARQEILHKQEELNYNDHTVRIKTLGNKISKARTKLELSIQIEPPTREKILKFFRKINTCLRHDSTADINTGVTLGHKDDVNFLVNIQNAVKNPDMYTGLIASKANFLKPLSSLYLFNLIYENYLYGRELAEPYLKTSSGPLSKIISECCHLLESQGRTLHEFFGKVDVIISNGRKTQDKALKSLYQQLSLVQREKEYYIEHILFQQKSHYSKLISNDPNYVGTEKFHLAETFCNNPMNRTAVPQTYGTVKQFARETGATTFINGVQTACGVSLLGPGYLLVGAAGQGVSFLKATNAALIYSKSQSLKKKHDSSTLPTLFQKRAPSEPPKKWIEYLISKEKLIATVWLSQKGELCSKIERVGGGVFSKTDLSKPLAKYEVVKGKTSFEATYRLLEDSIVVLSNNSCIKIEEIQKLGPKNCRQGSRGNYDVVLTKLLKDYEAWLEPHSEIKEDNPFYPIKKNSQFVRSNDSSTVPLAFPKEVLKELEKRMDPDRALMEATGVGFLEPSYSFTKDIYTGGYILKIQYHFIDKANLTERKLYEEFEIAYVDDKTVKCFAKPSYSGVQKTNDPNLNELLIQLTYTNNKLGAPGDQSVCLGGGRWVAPSMRAFPGFYKLWRHYPECAVHFNSQYYTEEMSFCLMLSANGKLKTAKSESARQAEQIIQSMLKKSKSTKVGTNVLIWRRIRESKETLSEIKRVLSENYHLMIAYCRLISSMDGHSLRQKLEKDFGLLDPTNFTSLIDLIAGGIELPDIENKALANFKNILELTPSPYLALMNTNHCEKKALEDSKEPKAASSTTKETTKPKSFSPKKASFTKTSGPSSSYPPEDLGIDHGNPYEMRNNARYMYSGTDIEVIQTFLFKDEDSVNLMSPMNREQLAQFSKEIQHKLVDGKPLLFACDPTGLHFTAVAMIKMGENHVKILCKDSMGQTYKDLFNIFPDDYTVSIEFHESVEQSDPLDVGCGIYSLDNLKTMIHHFKKPEKKEAFIANFKTFGQFCDSDKMKDLRKNEFSAVYQKGLKLIERREKEMENVRPLIAAHHQPEIDAIAEKLREALPLRIVKNVKEDDEIKKSDHTNTFFVEFALSSNKIANKSYEYVYRIYPSNEISRADLIAAVSALGLSEEKYEIEDTLDHKIGDISYYHSVIKISPDRAGELGITKKEKYLFENNQALEGVNLVGECPTNGNKVYIPKGYEEIDFGKAAHLSKCSCCQKNIVNVKEVFFKNCQWETTTFDLEGNATETKGAGSHTLNLRAVEFVEFKAKKIA